MPFSSDMGDILGDARMLDRSTHRDESSLWSSRSTGGMVSSAHYRATEAGLRVLEAGGNAVDAAVVTSLALAVVESAGSGIGGMAMILFHSAREGRTISIPAACRAPANATPEEVEQSRRYTGYRAVAVPTYVAAMESFLSKHGTWSPDRVLEPAIALAEEGFLLTAMQSELMAEYRDGLSPAAAEIFSESIPLVTGGPFRQPDLANTLRRLSTHGFREFYEGKIATQIAQDMEDNGGFVCLQDLNDVREIAEEEPLTGEFRGQVVRTAGSPAGGRTLLEMLHLFAELETPGFDPDSQFGAELIAAIIRKARSDRRRHRLEKPTAPDFSSRDYARSAAAELRRNFSQDNGLGETSHISVMDRFGNAVALTQSIERSFGSKVVTPGLGFLYNGYMKGFKIRAKHHPHYLRPGAVARSNAAPTILLQDDRPVVAIGSTGSERMLSGILQVLIRLDQQGPFEAVLAPRLHATPESDLLIEADRFSADTLLHLERLGYRIERFDAYSYKMGGLHLVTFDGREYVGVAEPRRDGAAAGPSE